MKEGENVLDPQLWHACVGGMVQMPKVNSKVFYFPQGHAEHAHTTIDLRVPPHILCNVEAVKFMVDPKTDEVFAKLSLVPLRNSELGPDAEGGADVAEASEKPASFAKTLMKSDANNGGRFSVSRYCAETIFPRLDYSAEPPVQKVVAKDVQGETWRFRHIYRGTPRRHLLTTGWSSFVNQKKLVAGDSVVFLRSENGELCVGFRGQRRELGLRCVGFRLKRMMTSVNECPYPFKRFHKGVTYLALSLFNFFNTASSSDRASPPKVEKDIIELSHNYCR